MTADVPTRRFFCEFWGLPVYEKNMFPASQSASKLTFMAGYGVPEEAIDAKTLRRHYRDELDAGHVRARGCQRTSEP
jgi:hypothetical protein